MAVAVGLAQVVEARAKVGAVQIPVQEVALVAPAVRAPWTGAAMFAAAIAKETVFRFALNVQVVLGAVLDVLAVQQGVEKLVKIVARLLAPKAVVTLQELEK